MWKTRCYLKRQNHECVLGHIVFEPKVEVAEAILSPFKRGELSVIEELVQLSLKSILDL